MEPAAGTMVDDAGAAAIKTAPGARPWISARPACATESPLPHRLSRRRPWIGMAIARPRFAWRPPAPDSPPPVHDLPLQGRAEVGERAASAGL